MTEMKMSLSPVVLAKRTPKRLNEEVLAKK
jgi:hypothetical protein